MSTDQSIAQPFDSKKLYFSVFEKEAFQGSILTRRNTSPVGWYEVVSLSPLVLEVPGPGQVTIPSGCDPRLTIKIELYKHQVAIGEIIPKKHRASRAGQMPKKGVNYAAMVLGR